MLPSARRILGSFAVRNVSSTTVLCKMPRRDKKSGKKQKPRNAKETVGFPQKFENRMRLWTSLVKKEIAADGKSGDLSGERDVTHVSGCKLLKCYFDPLAGKVLEFQTTSAPLPVKMIRKGVPLTIIGSGARNAVECVFWGHNGEGQFKVKCREADVNLTQNIGSVFTLDISNDFGALYSLAEFLDARAKWEYFPGYKLLQHAYRAVPMPMELSDRKLDFVQKLNIEQEVAVRAAMNNRRPLISIQGPPGTGKTYVVTEIIFQALRSNQKILVCAPTNQAVDNVLARVQENERACRLDSDADISMRKYMEGHALYDDLVKVYGEVNKVMKEYGEEEEISEMEGKAHQIVSQMKGSIVKSKNVVFATTSSSSLRGLNRLGFKPDIVLIDEAGQVMECASWMPLLQGTRGILVGDHQQLSATMRSQDANRAGLGRSLMQALTEEFGQLTNFMLTTQYRMNDKISRWSSEEFYDSMLQSDTSAADITLADISSVPREDLFNTPLVMVDTDIDSGRDYGERREAKSFCNEGEAEIVATHVKFLLRSGVEPHRIGVISPYSAQVRLLKDILRNPQITVSSVDAFQGQEKDAILMSLVRNNHKQSIGFLSDNRRMNVAVTRARRQFVLVSSGRMMALHKPMANLYKTIQKHGIVAAPVMFLERNEVVKNVFRK
ncbi:hypothetical protein L596_006801 [Steinernema carpocapsae]|uniref:AAA+ ATPase domain-containing protein n=1 Tax=Steinernema carpocapsae TaxID=34508 RepID=A0A4V6A5T0_STECR|nr:hypothetical protein L596_006801 [Steinernema carpocapsae]